MSVTKRQPSSYSTAIQQIVPIASFFDGVAPQQGGVAADCTLEKGIYKFPSKTSGGLFFWHNNEAIICGQFHIDMGAAANMSLYLVNLDPASVDPDKPTLLAGQSLLIEQATGTRFVTLDEARFKCVILPGQALQLITTASGVAQIAQAVASIERTYVR